MLYAIHEVLMRKVGKTPSVEYSHFDEWPTNIDPPANFASLAAFNNWRNNRATQGKRLRAWGAFKYCLEAYNRGLLKELIPIQKRPENFKHFKKCTYNPCKTADLSPGTGSKRKLIDAFESDESPGIHRDGALHITSEEIRAWERIVLEFQHQFRLPDLFIDHPTTQKFIDFKRNGLQSHAK
jgi:hypothetical protein